MKHLIPALLLTLSPLALAVAPVKSLPDNNLTPPKNIIMIVGDGMGPAYTTAYRYYRDDPATPEIEGTVFDRTLVGMSSTYPAPVSGYVTDSAAGATALATGIKSYNGAISVDVDKKPLESVLVWAKKHGKKTGIVVTSQINHATPAAYIAHNESRRNYDAIANSYFDDRANGHFIADVMFGGGWSYFQRSDRNLVTEFTRAGFQYIDKYDSLSTLANDKPVLGLFADVGLPWAIDDENKHRLSLMAKSATRLLSNPEGFFMLIEASQVDWGGHANDITDAMNEMDDLAKTLEYLEHYVNEHPDTLVVLTADHSTGGLTIGANGKYEWLPQLLRTMTMSPSAIAEKLSADAITAQSVAALLHFDLTTEELTQLTDIKTTTAQQLADYNALSEQDRNGKKQPNVEHALYKTLNNIIDQRTNTGWTSGGHTAIDVPVFAMGAGKALFSGHQDNTDIAKKIFHLLGKTDRQ